MHCGGTCAGARGASAERVEGEGRRSQLPEPPPRQPAFSAACAAIADLYRVRLSLCLPLSRALLAFSCAISASASPFPHCPCVARASSSASPSPLPAVRINLCRLLQEAAAVAVGAPHSPSSSPPSSSRTAEPGEEPVEVDLEGITKTTAPPPPAGVPAGEEPVEVDLEGIAKMTAPPPPAGVPAAGLPLLTVVSQKLLCPLALLGGFVATCGGEVFRG